MALVDPEQLEREADELAKKLYNPDPEADTPAAVENEAPAGEADTAKPDDADTPTPEASGSPEKVDEDGDPVLTERLKNAQARMTKATQEAADLRRQLAAATQRIAQLESNGGEAPAKEQADPEGEIKRLLEEYPEIATPILNRMSKLTERLDAQDRTAKERAAEDATTAHLSAIREAHADMDTIVSSDDFDGWMARQTPVWQRVAQEGSASEVIELLGRYKRDMGLSSDSQPQQGESAVDRARRVAEPSMPKARKPEPNNGRKQWTRAEIAGLSNADFEKHEAEIDRAIAEGRVR